LRSEYGNWPQASQRGEFQTSNCSSVEVINF
jgi:hypothetical protein